MTTLPMMMATTAASLTVSIATASQNADLNNDGVVNSTDLVLLASNIGTCHGECPTDLNNDGVTDASDALDLMKLWGPVPNFVPQEDSQDQATEATETRDPNRDMSWQGQAPVLLDSIYYDSYRELSGRGGESMWGPANEYNQGEFTQAWASSNNINVQPMIYGAVDYDNDGSLSGEDKEIFANWINQSLPADYSGPICLDLEGQWWAMLDSSNQAVVDVAINAYLEQLAYAKTLRPNAKIGFWGFPKKSHTKVGSTTASVQRLVDACTALFPDVYEHNPVGNDSVRLQAHVARVIEMVQGEAPVYAQAFPRFKTSANGLGNYHNKDEFMRDQVQSALDAVWTDANGTDHHVNGIAIWDAYSFVATYTEGWSEMTLEQRKAEWNVVDNFHVELLTGMKALVEAASGTENTQIATSTEEANEVQTTNVITAAAAPKTKRPAQLTRTVKKANPTVTFVKASSTNTKSAYRSARSSWTQSRRTFASAMRKYSKGSRQYNSAYAAYKQAQEEMRAAAQAYRSSRTSNRTARATMNQAKEQMKTVSSKTTMVASK